MTTDYWAFGLPDVSRESRGAQLNRRFAGLVQPGEGPLDIAADEFPLERARDLLVVAAENE